MSNEIKMNEETQQLFDTLVAMRGIIPLNRHLLNLLIEMNGGMESNVQKFLCLFFSLLDDGNTSIALDPEKFQEKWNQKWNGLLLLLKSQGEEAETVFNDNDMKSLESEFAQIIACGVNAFMSDSLEKIVTVVNAQDTTDEYLLQIDKPLVLTKNNGCFLYLTKHFIAKRDIEMTMNGLFEKDETTLKSVSVQTSGSFKLNQKQMEAVQRGASGESLIVTGGPGTGKTTVVLYILWNLLLNHPEKLDYSIYLAAPSGKAADRMRESLMKQLDEIDETARAENADVYDKLKNLESSTIHRLLKFSRRKGAFTYDKNDKFPENSIFVIDEASMIDIGLFSALLQAIPKKAHVFILGDPYQLPSVDSGAVLGELLNSEKNFKVMLEESMRTKNHPGIMRLAEEIKVVAERKGTLESSPRTFSLHPALEEKTSKKEEVNFYKLYESDEEKDKKLGKMTERLKKVLKEWAERESSFDKEKYTFFGLPKLAKMIDVNSTTTEQTTIRETLWTLSLTRRILSAERRGVLGVEQINKEICSLIREKWKSEGNSLSDYSKYIPGQLLMISKNQEMFKLYNGDTGIVVFDGDIPYLMLKKASKDMDSKVKSNDGFVFYQLSLLPTDALETAFAITIHKSQGSEYDEVTMFLPEQIGHPLLNNQILYTGVTRAKNMVEVIATPETFKAACETVITRDTGIEL